MMKSTLLKTGQSVILALRLNYILKPFANILLKLYCLSKFADWKKAYNNNFALKKYVNRFELYSQIIKNEQLDRICYLEFGVSKGESIKWWLSQIKQNDSRFFGFDTFEGIPENWGTKPKGSYSNDGNYPVISDSRCKFIKGLFQETLPGFFQTFECNDRLIIHFDADLYSSTLFCLFTMAPYLKSGDLLIFDEFNITTHEFRAFLDFQNVSNFNFLFIGESNDYNKVVLKIK